MEDSTVSIIALIFSLISLGYTIYRNRKIEEKSHLSQNLNVISNVELKALDYPEIFKVHGITKQEIIETGYTEVQFAYLVTSFTAASIFFRKNPDKSLKSFQEDGYRYHIISQPEFKKVWKLLKKMMENSDFRDRVEAIVNNS